MILLVLGCQAEQSSVVDDKTATGGAMNVEDSRGALVYEAADLQRRAERESGKAARELYVRAAELREKSYQREGKRVDALEALELWGAALTEDPEFCEAGLRMSRLRGVLEKDPKKLFRELYVLRLRTPQADCRVRLDAALTLLDSAAPSSAELAQLRKELGPRAASEAVSIGNDPHVVVPRLLEKQLEQAAVITKVEPFSAEQSARVVVHVTHPTRFQVGLLEASVDRGPRLYVDLELVSYDGSATFEQAGLAPRVRLGARDKGIRVVVDLSQVAYHRVFYLPDPFRLIVDLSTTPPDTWETARRLRRVVLDPGHGGVDPGAIGPHGLREKDVTLDIAHRAAPLLAREVGVSTLLTRDVDVFVPLDERAARANAFSADLFVSIHMNSSPDPNARGIMTFVLDRSRDEAAAQIAARENSSTAAAAAELANSLSRIESADRRAASELFADLLQKSAGVSLRQAYPDIEDHGVRRAGFYVLAGAAMPAVLFEGSFLSNPTEARRLDSEAYRQRIADALVNAVRAYKEGMGADSVATRP